MLCLTAFNLIFRLGLEIVSEWDESLYAISAWEMRQTGNFVGTTFLGALDYYNTKPPLNVWLIALSFKTFGMNLISLRLVSVASAWLTVAVLQSWARRAFGPAVAIFAGLVLATTFGFVYVHSGRTAETDALFTLLILLTAVVLWAEERQPWQRAWLGPIAAAVFLLRGMAVLMPVAIVLATFAGRKRPSPPLRSRWLPSPPTIAAVALFAIPVGAWLIARWRLDRWVFLERLFNYDFVARSLTVIEEHPGSPFYYLNILQKNQYDWLVAGVAALLLFPIPWRSVRDRLVALWRGDDGLAALMTAWAGTTLLMPTIMRTKLPWYLNPFYPVFALGIAWLLVRGLSVGSSGRRQAILAIAAVTALGVAEGKLIWYPSHYRNVSDSTQGLLIQEQGRLRNRQVFQAKWDRAEIFVAGGVVGAERRSAPRIETFWHESGPGDCIVTARIISDPRLALIRSSRHQALYCRTE